MSRENVTMIEITEITEVMNYIEGLSALVFDLVDDAEEKLWEAFERKKPAIDTVLKDEGIYSEELKERCLEVYRNHKPDIHLYFGVADMLKGIRKRGMNIGIITDGRPEGQQRKI